MELKWGAESATVLALSNNPLGDDGDSDPTYH